MNNFFDFASGSPVHPLVIEEMIPFFNEHFINIASNNNFAKCLKEKMHQRLTDLGDILGLNPNGFIITSGATESINHAILGAINYYQPIDKVHVVTSKIEHSATLAICHHLESIGHKVSYINTDRDGIIDLNDAEKVMSSGPFLACFHHINNETGVVQPIEYLCHLARENGVLIHIDASQTLGKLKTNFSQWNADYISFCAHKIQGPIGVGLLYKSQKPFRHLSPIIHGKGTHHRPGTFPMALFMGMVKAIELYIDPNNEHVFQLRDRMLSILGPHITTNVNTEFTIPHITNLYFKDIFNDLMLSAIPNYVFSVGSACTSQSNNPSHVLKAMGLTDDEIHCSLRVSLHQTQTMKIVETFAHKITETYMALRKFLPDDSF